MLLRYKEKQRIIPENLNVANTLKTSSLHYLLFVAFVFFIILHTRRDTEKKGKDVRRLETDIVDYSGVECAYAYHIDGKVTVWKPFTITINYEPDDKCKQKMARKHLDDSGTVFRVQAYSIYELASAISKYVGNGTYKVDFRLTIPTKYIVMIFITYVNNQGLEVRRHARPLLRQIIGSPFSLNVIRDQNKVANTNPNRLCSTNESGIVTGRWIKCGKIFPDIERCGPWQTPEFDFDRIHGFQWLPHTCQYHVYTNDEIKKCFAKNGWDSIVFSGDSHMRYRAYHWATRLYGGCNACVRTHIKMVFDKVPRIEWVFDARGTRLPLSFQNITLPDEKYVHPKVRRSKFSTPFPEDALGSKLFLLNFGHWILRESVDIRFMKEKLNAYGKAAKLLINQGKTVLWVNTVSLPWRTDQAVKNWRENTSPYRVKYFNKLSDNIITKYGIPMVNAYDISDGRIAATHDQTHYTKKLPGNDFGGVVENSISNVIFNKLCNTIHI